MKNLYLCFVFACSRSTLLAQEYYETLPENPDPNVCYAKCVVPDEFKEEVIRVMTKPEYTVLEILPAQYKTETEEIITKPASIKYTNVPAVYRTVYDTLWIVEPYHKLTTIPTSFSDDYETVEIRPKTGVWIAGEKDPDCPSIDNPDDCRIFHYIENQAITRDVPVKKVLQKSHTSSEMIAGKFQLVARQVEVSPATTKQEEIPAEKKAIDRKVLVKDETTTEKTIAAEYTEVLRKVLVKKGGMTAWRKVPCDIPESGIILPIHYALGSAALTTESQRIIDRHILSLMLNDQTTTVEIGSHTDSRGSEESNLRLSERRAKSVVDYLVSKGISPERLIAVGYGESKLLNNCNDGSDCSEASHQENRRTEFKVF
ncbi:MAG TPA: cell envelope biogenesis protein OmpA [Flavobacteriaceae bacterium]|jgi:OmpA-OmpF porin, OOP family|nr:cell envelope biogenesis protein OmpA [Flavobacteriaceae bacterium]